MSAATFSPIMMVGMLVLAQGTAGMIEASATRTPSIPWTRAEASVTAPGSSSPNVVLRQWPHPFYNFAEVCEGIPPVSPAVR